MADNVLVSNSSASVNPDYLVWTDELVDPVSGGTVQKQIVGIVDATAGGSTRAAVGANGLAVSATIVGSLPSNSSVNVAQIAGTTTAVNAGNASAGTQRVVIATDQSAIPISGSLSVTGSMPVTNIGTFAVQAATELATGLTPYSNTALSATKQQVKVSAGKVYGWMVHNPSAATAFIQVWDVASGSITVGTTAPTWTIQLPAGASANIFTDRGVTHATAINIAATTTPTGSSAPGTALVVTIFYI